MMNPETAHKVKIANNMARLLEGLVKTPTGVARLDKRL
jgi:hypothetical protein